METKPSRLRSMAYSPTPVRQEPHRNKPTTSGRKKVKPAHLWLDLFDHCAAASSSPGGKEENTGAASKLSDRVTMGTVEVISSDPVKLLRSNRGGIFCAPCPLGGNSQILSTLASVLPIRVPSSKGNQSRCVGRVGIGHSGPILAFSLLGKGDKAGGRNCRRIDSRLPPRASLRCYTHETEGWPAPAPSRWPAPSRAQAERSTPRRSPGERIPPGGRTSVRLTTVPSPANETISGVP